MMGRTVNITLSIITALFGLLDLVLGVHLLEGRSWLGLGGMAGMAGMAEINFPAAPTPPAYKTHLSQ